MKKKTLLIMLLAFIWVLSAVTGAFAQSVGVIQSDIYGTQFDTLPTNYVQITDLSLANATIEGYAPGYTLEYGYTGYNNRWYDRMLIWNGSPNFGSRNADNSHNASLGYNDLPDVTLRFPNAAVTSDGLSCDILLTLSQIRKGFGKSDKGNGNFKIKLMHGWALSSAPAKTSFSKPNADDSAKNVTATRELVTMRVVERGTSTPISASRYPTMLVEFKDLDAADNTMKKSDRKARYNGTYAEGVEMISGWASSAVIPPDTSDIANTRLVNTRTINGNTQIKASSKMVEYIDALDPDAGDCGTLWSGFVAAVQPQGFSFYWTGCTGGGNCGGMGTSIGGQPTVAVRAMREGHQSTAAAASLGNASAYSGVNSWYTNTHLMNSNSTYTAKPGADSYLESMKVDGVSLSISDTEKDAGKSYYFAKLNKNPLPRKDIRTGQVLGAAASGYYTIQASFRHYPKYAAKKDIDKSKIHLGSDEEINYQLVCEEIYPDAPEGEHVLNDDLAGGILIVDPDSVRLDCTGGTATYEINENGIDMIFDSDAANGGSPKMTLTYTAKVDWDKYAVSAEDDIVNDLVGYNKPEVGGGRTGNPASFKVTSDISVTKEVTGKLRDTTKRFEFEVKLTGLEPGAAYGFDGIGGGDLTQVVSGSSTGNGFRATREGEAVLMFSAMDKQGFTVRGLPIGANYMIREAASDHVASYELRSDAPDPTYVKASDANAVNKTELATATETIDKNDGQVTVEFTNNRDPAPVTGVILRFAWIAAAIAILIGAAVSVRLVKAGKGGRR